MDKCHPGKSDQRECTPDKAEFWIDFRGEKVLIRYFPVYSEEGEYLGVLEIIQEIGWLQKLSGQKRLPD